ncbi:MAG: 30S ribosomal protein S3ae [Desulfurococcaceae archaeon]
MSTKKKYVARDKWKLKKWYEVVAPPVFGSIVIGTTPSDTPSKLIGRVMETTLYDITGDITQVHVKLFFQIIDVQDNKAITRFKGHELSRDYIRSLIRRKSSKIQGIFDVKTKDNYVLRLTIIALTAYRCKTSQKKAIRRIMKEHVMEKVPQLTFDELINEIVFGKMSQEIAEKARKIYPLRKVEIYKSKLLMIPTPEGLKPATVVQTTTSR